MCYQKNHKCILDTGSLHNFIKKDIIPKDATIECLETSINLELVDGKEMQTNEFIETKIVIEGDHSTEYKLKASILENMHIDIILGLPFLIDNDAKLDFKNNLSSSMGKSMRCRNLYTATSQIN